MEDEREVARRELREFAEIEQPTDDDVDAWLASEEQRRVDAIDAQARVLIRQHGRLAHHSVDGQMMAARTNLDAEQGQADLERLALVKERILDINRPWRRVFRGRRGR